MLKAIIKNLILFDVFIFIRNSSHDDKYLLLDNTAYFRLISA
jgi:hypothetical protein